MKNLAVILAEQDESRIEFRFLFIPNTEVEQKEIITHLLVYLQQMLKRDVTKVTSEN